VTQQMVPISLSYGEDRHELVQRLAYQNWEMRGRPLGSPGVGWLAAEEAVRSYLLDSGIELRPDEGLYCRTASTSREPCVRSRTME